MVGRRVGELLGLFDGDVVDGDKLGLFDGFDVVGFVGLLDGLLVVGILVGEMVGIEVGGFVFGAAVVNSNKLSVLMKWDDGKLSLFGQTPLSSLDPTPAHSAKGRNTASQDVVGIRRPLPRLKEPSSVRFSG